MRVFTNMYRWLRNWTRIRRDLHGAKRRLLFSPDFTHEEKSLPEKVSLQVHHGVTMYAGDVLPLSFCRSFCQPLHSRNLRSAGKEFTDGSILDFPSRYGRVLRFLRARFPNSDITAAEIDRSALDFCRRNFSSLPFVKDTFQRFEPTLAI